MMNLPLFLPGLVAALIFWSAEAGQAAGKPPNVVFFVVDDMNDWVGPLGHDQAITPNMDRLAESGVCFTNAHTAGVFCAPSRTALFTGRHASRTGCYTTQVYSHSLPGLTPLQVVLQRGGYATYGGGKLFHHPAGFVDLRGWDEFFVRDPSQKTRGWPLDSWTTTMEILPKPYPHSIFNQDREPADGFFLEWGPLKNGNEGKMADTIRTEWACGLLGRKHEKPLFLAVGLYTPHFPNYVPGKYFDLYDPAKIKPPPYKADDLDDLPPAVRKAKTARAAHHKRLVALDAVEDAIHGYLASISYADAMLGRVLDAIESGPNADNTIVILWSDHGYHHGQKDDWGKHTLWERTSNVPFIFAGPGIARGAKVDATVSLIDLFPTLVQLTGVKDDQDRDGVSLVPALNDPGSARDRNVLLPGMRPGEYAIINREWRYIRYADGGEELYQVREDPNEWHNLAGTPEHSVVKQRMRKAAPERFAPPLPEQNRLRLVIDGETFRWEPKNKKTSKGDGGA
jgi:arylsulfatase A-like enzyme